MRAVMREGHSSAEITTRVGGIGVGWGGGEGGGRRQRGMEVAALDVQRG